MLFLHVDLRYLSPHLELILSVLFFFCETRWNSKEVLYFIEGNMAADWIAKTIGIAIQSEVVLL